MTLHPRSLLTAALTLTGAVVLVLLDALRDEPIPYVPAEPGETTPYFDALWREAVELGADERVNLYGESDFDEWVLENGWIG